jgi:hypothetical protein
MLAKKLYTWLGRELGSLYKRMNEKRSKQAEMITAVIGTNFT